MENRHTAYDLAQMQGCTLEQKINMSKRRIQQWYDYWDGEVYVSFSGGKDSTVLKHIIDSMYNDVPAVFVNTGLEYPEIQRFVREVKDGKYEYFNSDVEIIRPEKRFDEVIKEYGYPVISKEVSNVVRQAQIALKRNDGSCSYRVKRIRGELLDKNGNKSQFNCEKYQPLLEAPFLISEQCCDIMKKKPAKQYEKRTGRKSIIGTMATESRLRAQKWMQNGCNAFESNRPKSTPLAFWTEQDVLEYIVRYKVPYATIYGQIQEEGQAEGQLFIDGYHQKLCTSGADRTGCMFCMFGCHLEKQGEGRFERMKETHPNQYKYCMKSVEDGGLGLKDVIDWTNEHCGTNIRY